MAAMAKPISPLRHDAVRDTYWEGKNTPAPWLIVMVLVVAAGLLAYGLH
jgi:hypothetical protein